MAVGCDGLIATATPSAPARWTQQSSPVRDDVRVGGLDREPLCGGGRSRQGSLEHGRARLAGSGRDPERRPAGIPSVGLRRSERSLAMVRYPVADVSRDRQAELAYSLGSISERPLQPLPSAAGDAPTRRIAQVRSPAVRVAEASGASRRAPSALASPNGRYGAQHLAAPRGAHGGDAVVHGETGDQTDQEARSAGHWPHLVDRPGLRTDPRPLVTEQNSTSPCHRQPRGCRLVVPTVDFAPRRLS